MAYLDFQQNGKPPDTPAIVAFKQLKAQVDAIQFSLRFGQFLAIFCGQVPEKWNKTRDHLAEKKTSSWSQRFSKATRWQACSLRYL